jgi:hypothetical protein
VLGKTLRVVNISNVDFSVEERACLEFTLSSIHGNLTLFLIAALSLSLFHTARVISNAVDADPLKDPWNYQLKAVDSKFSASNLPIISLTYLMNMDRDPPLGGSDQLGVVVMTHDCVATVPTNVIAPYAIGPNNVMPVTAGTRAWDLELTLMTPNLLFDGSQKDFLTGTEYKFTLRLCVRTEMQNLVSREGGFVAYDETNVQVDIELTANLGPLAISATADIRKDVNEQTKVVYTTTACQCDKSNHCFDQARHPNENIRVCVKSGNGLVELFDIQDMYLSQGGQYVIDAVLGRKASKFLAVEKFNATDPLTGQIAVIQFPALPVFYDNQENPAAIEISGNALMKFSRRVRGLRHLEDDPDVAGVGEFSLNVTLDPTTEDSSASKLMGAVVMFAVLTSTLLLL